MESTLERAWEKFQKGKSLWNITQLGNLNTLVGKGIAGNLKGGKRVFHTLGPVDSGFIP